jgi:hypothetical protein
MLPESFGATQLCPTRLPRGHAGSFPRRRESTVVDAFACLAARRPLDKSLKRVADMKNNVGRHPSARITFTTKANLPLWTSRQPSRRGSLV